MKIEPMSVDEIKEFLAHFDITSEHKDNHWSRRMGRLILAWAHERAQRIVYEHAAWKRGAESRYTQAWNSVLDEIGWPKDKR